MPVRVRTLVLPSPAPEFSGLDAFARDKVLFAFRGRPKRGILVENGATSVDQSAFTFTHEWSMWGTAVRRGQRRALSVVPREHLTPCSISFSTCVRRQRERHIGPLAEVEAGSA